MKDDAGKKKSAPARFYGWLNRRTGVDTLLHESLDEPIPGGARLAYVFGSGLLFIFISQVITGLCLALYYVPSAETAHTSVAYITKQVAAGAFLRSLHAYGSSAMIVVLLLHFLQTFLYGSYKGRREVLWMSGAVLSLLVMAMGFTGYLLPWDQKAYFATAVGTNIVGQVPFIGQWLTEMLRGGDTLGTLTLSRFYLAHVFLIPGSIILFIGIHIALFRKAGPAGPVQENPMAPKLPPESFFPRQVIMDMAFALLLMAGLGVFAYLHPMELGPIANPADTQFLPRPEWYYLPMFEWLKFWEGPEVVFAIVVVPGALALLFFLLPFLDRGLERRPWRRPLPLLGVSIVLVGAAYLGVRSRLDDAHDPAIAAQLARQAAEERAYSRAPFHPYIESPGAVAPMAPAGPVDPMVASGKGVFDSNGCSGCHGDLGTGTPAAPSLVGVTKKFSAAQLIALLRNPNAKMRAGGMPAPDLSPSDMSALLTYLGVLGTAAAEVPATYHVAQSAAPRAGAPPAVASPSAEAQSAEPAARSMAEPAPAGSVRMPETAPSAASAAEPAPPPAVSIAEGRRIFESHACFACHGSVGQGTVRAPALAPLVASLSDRDLDDRLSNPTPAMRAGGMPPLVATPEQVSSLIAYLRTLSPPEVPAPLPTPAAPPSEAAPPAAPPAEPPAAAMRAVSPPAVSAAAAAPQAIPAAVAGRAIFLANGCSGCHGPTAGGTQFAPALAGVALKYPGARLPALLRNPNSKMRAGGMPTVTVSDAQLQQLVAYLTSLGAPASRPAGSPAQRSLNSSGAPSAPASPAAGTQNPPPLSAEAQRGRRIFETHRCETCHGIGGRNGTIAAPGLAGMASLLPATTIEGLLRHHSAQMQNGGMPLTNMPPRDLEALAAYIRSMPSPSSGSNQ